MKVGAYTLDLYCDNERPVKPHDYGEFPHQFVGRTEPDCIRQARRKGWLIGYTLHLCPRCNGKEKPKIKDPNMLTLQEIEALAKRGEL